MYGVVASRTLYAESWYWAESVRRRRPVVVVYLLFQRDLSHVMYWKVYCVSEVVCIDNTIVAKFCVATRWCGGMCNYLRNVGRRHDDDTTDRRDRPADYCEVVSFLNNLKDFYKIM